MADFAAICFRVAFISVLFIPVFSASATKCGGKQGFANHVASNEVLALGGSNRRTADAGHDQRDEYRSDVANNGHNVFSSTVCDCPVVREWQPQSASSIRRLNDILIVSARRACPWHCGSPSSGEACRQSRGGPRDTQDLRA